MTCNLPCKRVLARYTSHALVERKEAKMNFIHKFFDERKQQKKNSERDTKRENLSSVEERVFIYA